jgi:predicted ester cyclase
MGDPKRVVERHIEAFNGRQADADPWAEDAEFVAPATSMRGRGDVLAFLRVFWDAFPDGRLETVRLFAEGSVVAAEGTFTGTHTGVMRTPSGEVPATGRQVDFRWMSSYDVHGDELVSEHLYFDQLDLLGQLGVMQSQHLERRRDGPIRPRRSLTSHATKPAMPTAQWHRPAAVHTRSRAALPELPGTAPGRPNP